jgi:uncharacterized membrane protein
MTTKENPDQEPFDQWHQDPENWKWGIFYFNKKDKRIFPPKRLKRMGWTVNFANPVSWLTMLAIIIALIVMNKFLK